MARAPRRIVLVAYEGFQLIDLGGPADVFDTAGRILRGEDAAVRDDLPLPARPSRDAPPAGYELVLATPSGRAVRASNGLRIGADASLADVEAAGIDTVLLSGAPYFDGAFAAPRLLPEVRRLAAGARRTASVCSGSLLLAATGLLDGRRATTHWAACAALTRLAPAVRVEPDRIFVRDGDVFTSAGATAGMDLALALVEDDHGPELARRVARWMVMFAQRPGGQSQFSERLALPLGAGSPIRMLVDEIVAEPAGDHRVPALADRAAVSERHLARLFAEHAQTTPGRFVERVRVEAARDLLESTRASTDAVAARCGFGSTETMRRAFVRVLGVGPREYRERFQREALPAMP